MNEIVPEEAGTHVLEAEAMLRHEIRHLERQVVEDAVGERLACRCRHVDHVLRT
jgi:hypothetical protein